MAGSALPKLGSLRKLKEDDQKTPIVSEDDVVQGFRSCAADENCGFLRGQRPGFHQTELVLYRPNGKVKIQGIRKYNPSTEHFTNVSIEEFLGDKKVSDQWVVDS